MPEHKNTIIEKIDNTRKDVDTMFPELKKTIGMKIKGIQGKKVAVKSSKKTRHGYEQLKDSDEVNYQELLTALTTMHQVILAKDKEPTSSPIPPILITNPTEPSEEIENFNKTQYFNCQKETLERERFSRWNMLRDSVILAEDLLYVKSENKTNSVIKGEIPLLSRTVICATGIIRNPDFLNENPNELTTLQKNINEHIVKCKKHSDRKAVLWSAIGISLTILMYSSIIALGILISLCGAGPALITLRKPIHDYMKKLQANTRVVTYKKSSKERELTASGMLHITKTTHSFHPPKKTISKDIGNKAPQSEISPKHTKK